MEPIPVDFVTAFGYGSISKIMIEAVEIGSLSLSLSEIYNSELVYTRLKVPIVMFLIF